MKLRLLLVSVISLFALVSFAIPGPVAAQTSGEPTSLDNFTLWLYPEYDDPRLLVMLEGNAAAASFPATIRFLVPQGAEMFSAGSKDAQGNYTGGPPERKASNIAGWDEISYQLKNPTFRVEYYTDEIRGLPDKQIAFDFYYVYPIRNLHVFAQQPLTATNFTVSPNGTAAKEGPFNVQVLTYANLVPDPAKPLHIDIGYTKADLSLSIDSGAGTVPPLANSGGTGPSGLSAPVILGLIAAALAIAAVFYWLGTMRRPRPRLAEVQPAPRTLGKGGSLPRAQNKPAPPRPGEPISRDRRGKARDFCDQCGSNLDKNDRFCPSCGSKLD